MKEGSAEKERNALAARVKSWTDRYRGVLALVAVVLLGCIFSPENYRSDWPLFLTLDTQLDVLFEYSEVGILATGMTLVILTGGIDLSVGSVLGMSATLFSLMVVAYGLPVAVALPAAVLAGAVAGCLCGGLIAKTKMQPFVATLAMMAAARGMAKLISGGIKVQPGAREWYAVQSGTPAFFETMTSALPGIPVQPVTLLFVFTLVFMWLVVKYTRFGRHLYAIGGSEEAARLSGIRIGLTKVAAYGLCGLFAGLAGVCNASRMTLGDPEAGSTYELDAIAAVVIGGTSLMGGRGNMLLTLLGTLIIGYINKILSLNAVPEHYRLLAKGAIIVAAVLIQQKRRD
ncbi:MAG TPA: ABC transporter permease [Candidatus Brocadiia bacterium]|nr:ABC transporter permease [Candidatus Brocadiia bacterium]